MPFHVPFNQRPSGRENLPGPIYIGFDTPAVKPRCRFNWWGFHGMWMSFFSLFSAGFLSPIPLLISLVGLRRPGKIMASIGAAVSLFGVLLAGLIVSMIYTDYQNSQARRQAEHYEQVVKREIAETEKLITVAQEEIEQFVRSDSESDPSLLDEVDLNMLLIKHVDPWGASLRFELDGDQALIRSGGPDGRFYTDDDITQVVPIPIMVVH